MCRVKCGYAKPIGRLVVASVVMLSAAVNADGPKDNLPDNVRRVPRLGIEVSDDQRLELESQLTKVETQIDAFRALVEEHPKLAEMLPDIEVLHRAARDALEYQEFFKEREIDDALQLLELGLARSKDIQRQLNRHRGIQKVRPEVPLTLEPWLQRMPRNRCRVRGFESRIDKTVQPYGLVFPEDYQPGKKYRLDVWFHGRGENVSENVFLTQRRNNVGVFAPKDAFVLHPYGRYSNAFKFAGEVDVLEAIEHVRNNYPIDDDRTSVRGFSMGGAGCWQFAVHYADRWFAANPGAGFSETPEFLRFFQKETLRPTWYEEKLWRMYDCNLWATNLLHCPTVAYSGEVDIQKQAADIMATALSKINVELVHVIGPKTGHKYHPDSAKKVSRRLGSLAKVGRDQFPQRLDFVTYTLKYNRMHWLTVDALEEHWERSQVSAAIKAGPRIEIESANVAELTIDIPSGSWSQPVSQKVAVVVEGKELGRVRPKSDRSLQFNLAKSDSGWTISDVGRTHGELRKQHNLQGPIDDALMDSFIFVRPTGKSENGDVSTWATSEMNRAVEHWRRHFRGYARVKNDTDITEKDINSANLILWGDPQSNRLMKRVLENRLPMDWGRDEIRVGTQNYNAANHALIAIYPNPLNTTRYVVFNSSFTFREFAYLNNARQVPKLPDWAVVDIETEPNSLWPGKIVNADFFDERWQLKKK